MEPLKGDCEEERSTNESLNGLEVVAGASLVQLYTGLAYGGPALVPRIKQELAECLRRDGFNSVSEVVGLDARES